MGWTSLVFALICKHHQPARLALAALLLVEVCGIQGGFLLQDFKSQHGMLCHNCTIIKKYSSSVFSKIDWSTVYFHSAQSTYKLQYTCAFLDDFYQQGVTVKNQRGGRLHAAAELEFCQSWCDKINSLVYTQEIRLNYTLAVIRHVA